MNIRQIQEARERYGIEDWGAGYFGIDDSGMVSCHPTGEEHMSINLHQAVVEAKKQGLSLPMILRFPQIIECQLERMHSAFREAIWEYNFKGKHQGVFPFKVNQRREFIDQITQCGSNLNYGLEVGSKTELIAALSYSLPKDALLIVNGFKDPEFIEMAFIAKQMGKRVVVVLEGPDELEMILSSAKNSQVIPEIGLRVRLASKGSGKWEKSSGDSSKFGLTASELIHALNMLKENNLSENLQMLHFHIGSQITEIKRFKNAIKEASRLYAKVCKMEFAPEFLNIGGGVGVDYDGSKTSFQSSANYSLQEFANDAVYVLGEVCNNEKVPHPTIITESGRVIAAYHSIVVTDIREVQGQEFMSLDTEIKDDDHKSLRELKYILDNVSRKNYVEFYHDAISYQEELVTLFNLGYLNLEQRAKSEQIFERICRKALYCSSFERHVPEEFENLQKNMVSKYLANFSIFQSIPDAWSIDQLFPVMPLSRHDEKPSHKASIVDITCDSDGCIDRFIDRREVRSALDLHIPNDQPYYIGFFLVGAYQESLANEHNLFGAINEAEIRCKTGKWEIVKTTEGDDIGELLTCRNYSVEEIQGSCNLQLNNFSDKKDAEAASQRIETFLHSYPYLLEKE